jgi:hypothetical protein
MRFNDSIKKAIGTKSYFFVVSFVITILYLVISIIQLFFGNYLLSLIDIIIAIGCGKFTAYCYKTYKEAH